MRGRAWCVRDLDHLAVLYPHHRTADLAEMFGRSASSVISAAARLGAKKGRRKWAAGEIAVLRETYPHRQTPEVAQILGRSICSVRNAAYALGLRKAPDGCGWLKKGQSSPGTESGRFRKGQVPANKGLRRPGWHAGRMRETQFKPGQMSGAAKARWKPVGTIIPDGEGYLRIKLRERGPGEHGWNSNVWKLYHHKIWEESHGPVPAGHLVTFRDGNRNNCAIENLELIPMKENAWRNSIWSRFPPELREVVIWNAVLNKKIRRMQGGKEQAQ